MVRFPGNNGHTVDHLMDSETESDPKIYIRYTCCLHRRVRDNIAHEQSRLRTYCIIYILISHGVLYNIVTTTPRTISNTIWVHNGDYIGNFTVVYNLIGESSPGTLTY